MTPRRLVLLLVALLVATGAAPALAAVRSKTYDDPARDFTRRGGYATAPATLRDNGDLRRLTISHDMASDRLFFKFRVTSVDPVATRGLYQLVDVDFTAAGRHILFAASRDRDGGDYVTLEKDGVRKCTTGTRVTFDAAADTVVFSAPMSCLGNPRILTRVGSTVYSGQLTQRDGIRPVAQDDTGHASFATR